MKTIAHKVPGVGRIFSEIVEDIVKSVDLVVLLRKLSDLDRLGDKILEDSNNTTATMIELYRLIQNSEGRRDSAVKSNSGSSCCLRDLFGFIFVEMLNNIAFGRGNPNLVDKVVKATNGDTLDIRTRIYRLAINRDLLPKDIIKLIDPKTPVVNLPPLVRDILSEQFSKNVLKDYQSFIDNIRIDGKAAFDRIIETHLRLVHKNARFIATKVSSLPIDDLIQEGSIGLMKAAEHFDPAYGHRFMSYAPYWIQQTADRAISDQGRTIRIPVHRVESINKLLRVKSLLKQASDQEPTLEEIGEAMDLSLAQVNKIIALTQMQVSLAPIAEEDSYLGDSIVDLTTRSPFDAICKQLLKEQIEEALTALTPREQRVIRLRFGLDDDQGRTLEEVAQEFNLTRERIRQIEVNAIRKLSHPVRIGKLRDCL
ncbi:MAG: sigma-70 family RNA polymerase sigma factor [Syntrophales bacterium]|nr:sigma-70 family RNA polymerase sigma factor [Syntrophales bacterium]